MLKSFSIGLMILCVSISSLNAKYFDWKPASSYEGYHQGGPNVEHCEMLIELLQKEKSPERVLILKTILFVELKKLQKKCEDQIESCQDDEYYDESYKSELLEKFYKCMVDLKKAEKLTK